MGLVSLAIIAAVALPDGVMQPSTGWNVDYAETHCTLSRSYGTGDDLVSLGIIPATGGAGMRVVLMAKNPDRILGSGIGSIRFDEGKPEKIVFYSFLDPQQGRMGLIRTSRGRLTPLSAAKEVTLKLGPRTLRFAVPQMAKALEALWACESDLAMSWGFDYTKVSQSPRPIDPQNWVSNNDYPHRTLDAKQGGETGFRVTVDATGKPIDCVVTEQSGVDALDKRACEIVMTRARYSPGLDKGGKPMIGLSATSITWTTPGSGLIF